MKTSNSIFKSDHEKMSEFLLKNEIHFEGRALPFTITPYLIPESKNTQLQRDFSDLYRILNRVIELYKNSDKVRSYFSYNKTLEKLIILDQGYKNPIHLARFDYTLDTNGEAKIYELNSECPGGMLLMRKIFAGYQETQTFKNLKLQYDEKLGIFSHYTQPRFSKSLLDIHQEMRPLATPSIAILNSKYNTLTNEVSLMLKELEELGLTAQKGFVEDSTFDGSSLKISGQEINICYQKFDYNESQEIPFTQDPDSVQDYLLAIKTGAVMATYSFASSYLIENKATLGLFWHPKLKELFTPEELNIVKRTCTPTHHLSLLSENQVQEILDNKEKYVLKKGLDTRGRSVQIGKNTDKLVWTNCVLKAWKNTQEHFVIQDFIAHETMITEHGPQFVSHAYFMLRGEPVGPLLRFSSSEITNVGLKGSLGICFYEKSNSKHKHLAGNNK